MGQERCASLAPRACLLIHLRVAGTQTCRASHRPDPGARELAYGTSRFRRAGKGVVDFMAGRTRRAFDPPYAASLLAPRNERTRARGVTGMGPQGARYESTIA